MFMLNMWLKNLLLLLFVNRTRCEDWDAVKCSYEMVDDVAEGIVDIGKYSWLGLVIHNFYLGGQTRQAMTGGVLIHTRYALAPAEDIGRIRPEQLFNNTYFVVYRSASVKHVMPVIDFAVHPEYITGATTATISLLELEISGPNGFGGDSGYVLPICLPAQGVGTLEELFSVKYTDARRNLEKTVTKMKYVKQSECEEFYYMSQLDYKMKAPVNPLCAVSVATETPCVWEAGYVLITRQSGYWKLIGFGTRGPGCGAPARFLEVHRYLPWLDMLVSPDLGDEHWNRRAMFVERRSPIELILYSSKIKVPVEQGQCNRRQRGGVIYKDASEVLTTKSFGQGFFWLAVQQTADVTCVKVLLESTRRSNAVLWLEHSCKRIHSGADTHGHAPPYDYKGMNCFIYYTTTAYLEFRFHFSFRAVIEVTIYGFIDYERRDDSPFGNTEATESWWPTAKIIRWNSYIAYQSWFWNP